MTKCVNSILFFIFYSFKIMHGSSRKQASYVHEIQYKKYQLFEYGFIQLQVYRC